MSPLEEATVEELIEELNRRLPCLLVAGEKPTMTGDGFDGTVQVFGGLTIGLGLHQRLRFMLEQMPDDDYDDGDVERG